MLSALTLGDHIRLLRYAKGYSQEYVAYRLDISQSAYHKIESDKTSITLTRLIEITARLEIRAHHLIEFIEGNYINR